MTNDTKRPTADELAEAQFLHYAVDNGGRPEPTRAELVEQRTVRMTSTYPSYMFPERVTQNGKTIYRRPDLEVHDEIVYSTEPRPDVAELAQKIAQALAEQEGVGEVDDLGDGESIVFMDKCPTLNIVQLAEAMQHEIDAAKRGHALEADALKAEIERLKIEIENAKCD